jgi:hypothetical protein
MIRFAYECAYRHYITALVTHTSVPTAPHICELFNVKQSVQLS